MADPLIVYDADDRPSIWFQILNDDGVVDLSAATTVITWKFRAKGTTTVLDSGTCSKVKGGGVTGWVQMDWDSDTLDDLTAGRYEVEISISFNGEIHTVNYYYEVGNSEDTDKTMPIKVRGDF